MNARHLVLACLLSLTACQPADPGLALQADYLERLNNALDGAGAEALDPAMLVRYRLPARRERLIEIPELRISLLELLIEIRHCPPLQQLISRRNNSLGKQLQPSSRLAYEGELLRALGDCREHLTASGEERQKLLGLLDELAEQKRAQLPAVFWNALNGSREFERYLRFSEQALPVAPVADAGLDALAQLAELGQGLPARLPPPAAQLEPLFFALHGSDQGGALITSLASLSHTLEQASRLLEQRRQQRPLCPQGKPTARGRILQNVFVKFYAAGLQPYLAQVHQRGQRWSASLGQLSSTTQIPETMRTYLEQLAGAEDSLWNRFERANAEHVRAWQRTLRSCGLAPGQSGWQGQAASADQ